MTGGRLGTRVLVVDDEEDMRLLVRICLETLPGYEVETARGVSEALTSIARHPPDLIVTDVMMPGVSGVDMLEILRRRPETAGIPVVMFTCLSSRDLPPRVLADPLTTLVTKPASPAKLREAIEDLVGRAGPPAEVGSLP